MRQQHIRTATSLRQVLQITQSTYHILNETAAYQNCNFIEASTPNKSYTVSCFELHNVIQCTLHLFMNTPNAWLDRTEHCLQSSSLATLHINVCILLFNE